ncbi:replication-relaxation family protein [Streptomyces microflavus]|uniref:Replication-relaxation family protein n=1 Tax=Streptomyces microflavus TaxID=1919 RepID=A0ABV1QER2_STRMI
MGGASVWPYKSTSRNRGLVLLALGVVKVATAEQLRQLVLPGTADVQTVRNVCKDLRSVGLVESVGRTSFTGMSGRPVWRDLWNLTTAGLASAATELGRPVKEMSGIARDAAKAGAPHALAVTDTIDAFCQFPPQPTKPIARRTTPVPAPVRELPARPAGLGHLRGWETEVPLPVSGTFTTPARGSLRADAVLTAPEAGVPVLFVEVDNHTEPDAVVAWKIESYRRFFQRTTKDHRGRDAPFWQTLWDDSGRDGHPPLALVFAKNGVSPEARMNRMKKIRDLSTACWQGTWHSGSVSTTRPRTATATTAARSPSWPPPWPSSAVAALTGPSGGATDTLGGKPSRTPWTTLRTSAATAAVGNSAAPSTPPRRNGSARSARRPRAGGRQPRGCPAWGRSRGGRPAGGGGGLAERVRGAAPGPGAACTRPQKV